MSSYKEGQTNQLANGLKNAGFTPNEVAVMTKKYLLSFLDVIRGKSEIKTIEHFIDCDTSAFVPDGLKILPESEQLPNRIRGRWKFDPQKISLYLSKKQNEGGICGHDLRSELISKRVLKANVLDYLFTHPELIPKEWKGKRIFFWGTIFCEADGRLYVHYLDWDGFFWTRDCCYRLESYFDADSPAALAI